MALPNVNHIMEAVPKTTYVAALRLAHELALELCVQCADDCNDVHLHRDQVIEIEMLLVQAGEKLPPQSKAMLAVAGTIRDRLDPVAHIRQEAWMRGVVSPRRFYRTQDVEASQCEYKVCELGMKVRCGSVLATLTLKEQRYNGRHILRFSFADVVVV